MALQDYRQDLGRAAPTCTCPAFRFSGYHTCKHLLTERRRITLLEATFALRTTSVMDFVTLQRRPQSLNNPKKGNKHIGTHIGSLRMA